MLLRHLHLPTLTPYTHASALQAQYVSALLTHKASQSLPSPSSRPSTPSPPSPLVLTFSPHPVYTCGRREIPSISASQIAHLTAPTAFGRAEFHPAQRGGQTTFHGPGQLVAYPILDLKRHGLTPRAYICMLEESVIAVCKGLGVRGAGRTENAGVWVRGGRGAGRHGEGEEGGREGGEEGKERKICAVGVHLRRNVTSHGIGLNVTTEMGWFERIVACGLEGLGATSLEREGVEGEGLSVERIAEGFVESLARRLEGVEGVKRVEEGEGMGK